MGKESGKFLPLPTELCIKLKGRDETGSCCCERTWQNLKEHYGHKLMKIPLIDDTRMMQVAIRRALEKAGHQVLVASDGSDGLQTARSYRPDVILLDLMLPGTTGTAVLRALKTQVETSAVPVFVLSGLSRKNAEKLIEDGAAGYFEKSTALLEENFASLVRALEQMPTTQEKARSVASSS